MMTFIEFQGKLQDLVREMGTIARQRYLARLRENSWQTIKDVPQDQYAAFVTYVEHGDQQQEVS